MEIIEFHDIIKIKTIKRICKIKVAVNKKSYRCYFCGNFYCVYYLQRNEHLNKDIY